MEKNEFKSLAITEFHVKAEGDDRTIEGYASVFNYRDSYDDIVLPGAFAKSLTTVMPLMLYQHDRHRVPGVWKEAYEDSKGLYVKGHFINTTLGRDVYEEAKSGAIHEFSIGYRPTKHSYDKKSAARMLHEIALREVSLVTFAVNDQAKIMKVKSEDGSLMSERQFEEFLRDVGGLSQMEAKRIVSDGYKAIAGQRDVEGHELEGLFQLLNHAN